VTVTLATDSQGTARLAQASVTGRRNIFQRILFWSLHIYT